MSAKAIVIAITETAEGPDEAALHCVRILKRYFVQQKVDDVTHL